MKAFQRWGTILLLAALVGCGDSGGAGDDGNGGGGDGDGTGEQISGDKPIACEVASAQAVSEVAGATFGSQPQDNASVSVCFYASDSDDVFMSITLRIEYDGAENLDASVEGLEGLGGTTEDVSGIGDAAVYHFYTQESGGFSSNAGSLLVTQGKVLVSVTVGDIDLTKERALELAEAIARLSLAKLE